MSTLKNLLFRWGPAIVMMAIIFTFSSIPADELVNFGVWDFIVKKSGHALGYALLALTFLYGLRGAHKDFPIATKIFWLAWLFSITYSATDEFHQSFVRGRHPSLWDVLIDAVGAALALFITSRVRRQK